MGEGKTTFRGRAQLVPWLAALPRGGGAWLLAAASGCGIDFGVERAFLCPPETSNCILCNADGSCREPLPDVETPPLMPAPPPAQAPDASAPEQPAEPPEMPPEDPPVLPGPPGPPDLPPQDVPPSEPPDPPMGGPTVPRDAGPPDPPQDESCAEYASRASDSLCLQGEELCFSLGSVLSPALVAWLDPTTLPRDGSRYWCDRSGQRHHALLQPEASSVVIEPDGRAVSEPLARSLTLDGNWLSLSAGTQPALVAGNFAVVLAVAAQPEPEPQPFELFESGAQSRVNLTLLPATGRAEGRITSLETALVTSPVVTQSSVYDGAFHLYSLYRRSEVRVLDDVLQLRLNGTLEFRGSSIAIPRALDLSSPQPRLGSRSTSAGISATGYGRIAAAVLFRGSVPEDELARLENFLCTALAVCGAPVPASPPGPAVPTAPPASGAPPAAGGAPAR